MSTKATWRNNVLTFYDATTHERVLPVAPLVYVDDFLGAGKVVIPAAAESGMAWVSKIVGDGPPTVAGVADAANGAVACALQVKDQKQDAACYHGDQRGFSLEQGLVFEARVKVSVLPTLLAEAVFGLIGDWIDGPDAALYSAFFTADGSGEIFCEVDDNATDQSATSGVTVLATGTHVYRIDFVDLADIKFYIDGERVATGTTFRYVATGANAVLQPYFAVYKAAGAGLGTVEVDYVRLWQKRS